MARYNFYEVRSQRALEYADGLRKVSLSCENRPDVHAFFWVDAKEKIQHIQLLFDEHVLEWNPETGIHSAVTNRNQQVENKLGFHKGIRSIHSSNSQELHKILLQKVSGSEFPEPWNLKIHEKFEA